MEAAAGGQGNLLPAQLDQSVREGLRRLTSRELMDALMAADMPMGGTDEQRIERLLSVMQPQDLMQFLSPAQLNQSAREGLRRLTSRELMDALMAADMPMGGTDEQRIERLLSVMQPQDLMQFLSPAHGNERRLP